MPPATLKERHEAVVDKLEGQSRSLEQVLEDLKEGKVAIEEAMRFATRLDSLEEELRRGSISLPGLEDEQQDFNFGGVLRMVARGVTTHTETGRNEWGKSGLAFEADVLKETRESNRASGVSTTLDDEAAGELVPMEAVPGLIPRLEAAQVLSRGGMQTQRFTGEPAKWRKKIGATVAKYHGEGTSIPKSKMTYGEITARKRKISVIAGITRELASMSSIDQDRQHEEEFFLRLALRMDLAGLMGSGSEHEPRGIWNLPNATVYDVDDGSGDGDILSYIHHSRARHALKRINVPVSAGDLSLIIHPDALQPWLEEKNDGVGTGYATRFYNLPLTEEALLGRLASTRAILETTQLPLNLTKGSSTDISPVIYARLTQMINAMWLGFILQKSDQAVVEGDSAFEEDLVFYKLTAWHDYVYPREEEFCLLKGVKSTLP